VKVWIVIVLVGTLNYLSRLSFIAFFSRRTMPVLLERALRYVPAAMLTALIVPMIVTAPPTSVAGIAAPRVIAATIAVVVAYHTRSTILTLGCGMVAVWVLQALLPLA
jgi:branched-subunit amino acid transport protein